MEDFDEVELDITPEKLFEMKKSGMTYEEIAEELDVKPYHVGGAFKALGLPTFRNTSVSLEPEEALELVQEGKTTEEVADEFDCSEGTVERRIAEAVQG